MKVILMKQTLQYLTIEAQNNNTQAQELLTEFNLMDIVEKEKYFVLTDKIIASETT